jgi:hypothetical protein
MTPIIAGRFEQEAQAEAALAALRHGGFDAADVTVFLVNPAGRHGAYPAKPDERVVELAATAAARRDADTASARSSGIFVAVRAVEFARRVAAVNVLRAKGGQDIERADGTWRAGKWIDFDPLKPPLLVDLPAPEDVQLRE